MGFLRALLLMVLCVALTARGEALIVLLPAEEAQAPLPVRRQVVTIDIDGRAARTTWRTTFFNPGASDAEGTFLFTLPADAQVSDFLIKIDGKELRGEVLPRDEARNIYEGIVRRLRDPGLLEHLDDRTVKLRVFPLRANQESDIEIEYLQTLRQENGLIVYEIEQAFPAGVPVPADSEFAVNLEAQDSLGLIHSPTHDLNIEKGKEGRSAKIGVEKGSFNGRFTLFHNTSAKDVGLHFLPQRHAGEKEGKFLLIVNAPEKGPLAEPMRKDVVFVLDTSGSMSDEGELDKAKSALRQCLNALNKDDSFGIVSFSTAAQTFRPSLVGAEASSIEAASEWLRELRPRGGTNIHQALEKAVELLEDETSRAPLRQVIFFTDGQPTVGKTDALQIVDLLPDNARRPLRVFALGFGYEVNAPLLDEMSEKSGAFADYIHPDEDLELTITNLFKAVSSPVLTNVKLKAEGIEITEQYPPDLPDLFLGKELIVAGVYKGHGPATLSLTGTAGDKDYSAEAKIDVPENTNTERDYVRAIWANRKVGYLLEQVRQNGFSEELKKEIVALATEYNLVTPYTSFLAAPDDEYSTLSSTTSREAADQEHRRARHEAKIGDIIERRRYPQLERQSMDLPAAAAPESVLWDTTGAGAVNTSEALREQKGKATVGESEGMRQRQQRHRGQVYAGGQQFLRSPEGVWVQQTAMPQSTMLRIKYLSTAYFELLKKYPEYKQQMLLGERVQLLIGRQWVEIGEEGAAEKLPEW